MIPASGPGRVSGLVRALWAELTKPADELDLAAIDAAFEGAVAAQAAACDASGMLFGHKSHQGKPPKAGPWRPRSWHEVPLLVALAAMPAGVGWRERLAELVAQFGPGLDEGLEIELERAEKRTPRPRALRAVELLFEGATDAEAAEELGLSDRSLRGSVAWRRLREALAAFELRKRR